MALKLASIKIKNVLGIEDLELTPDGNIIQVSGKNGSGKTSTIEAIKNAIGVGSYSTILRDGCEKGEVVLDLGDMLVRKTHKPNGESLTLKGKIVGTDKMSNISAPAGVLRTLVNPNSVDPVRLLTAKPKELLDAVLSALPMSVDNKVFSGIIGNHSIDIDQHALVVIAKATQILTEDRKLLNRDAKTAKITKEQLAATLPESVPLSEEIEAQIDENTVKAENIRSMARSAARVARTPYMKDHEDLESQRNKLIEDIAKMQGQLEVVNSQILKNQDDMEKASNDAREETLAQAEEYLDENVTLSKELSSLNVYKNTQSQVREWERKEAEATKASDDHTGRLKALQEYKEELCDNLPIEGLAVVDGRLMMNGISFETLNTASRVQLVIELAKLTSGDLGIVVLDNSECMDKDTYNLFLEEAAKTDLIFIVARVEDHELSVK